MSKGVGLVGWAPVCYSYMRSGNILDMVLFILLLLLGNGGMAVLLMDGLIAARSAAVSDGRNVHHSVGGLTKAGAQNILIWTECRSSCFWVDELIDKLQHLPAFREGDQNNIIARLKKSWTAYQKNSLR